MSQQDAHTIVAIAAMAASADDARVAAYDTAAAVCHADGELNEKERAFLSQLLRALGAVPGSNATNATPRVEERIKELAGGTNLNSILAGLRA